MSATALISPMAAVVSGMLLWAASPAVGYSWLAWVALVPAAAAAVQRGSRLALPLALGVFLELSLVPALPFGVAENQWADDPVLPVMVGESPVLAAALVGVPFVVALLYLIRFPLTLSPLGAAAVWTALDLLRSKLDPSGLWGPLYLSQHDTPAAALAAVGGPWLVTFALVAVNFALARRAVWTLAGIAALLAVAGLTAPGETRPTFTVAAVQPGYDTAEYERPLLANFRAKRYEAAARDLVADLAPLTREAARRGADLVVWPEAVLWVEPARVRPALTALALDTGAAIVVPFFLPRPAHGGALVVLPDGTLTRAEPKHRPMWFVGERGGNRLGSPRPLALPRVRLGPMLGVDDQDAGTARALAARDAGLLSSSTHDWEQLAPQHAAFARLASAALGRPLVRADWRYGSAVYDRGRLVADTGTERRRTVVIARVGRPAETLYARVGDWPGWALVAVAAVVAVRRRASAG